ncbi:MAG: DUF3842 family protein [Acutalibacteraceae bacterium]
MMQKNILVIDGQGGRIGREIIERLKAECPSVCITAVGTNSMATAAMLKGGADQAATGENAVMFNAAAADILIGPVGIVVADALLGEITPAMAAAVGRSRALKLLIPVNQCNNIIVGVGKLSVKAMLDDVIDRVKAAIE